MPRTDAPAPPLLRRLRRVLGHGLSLAYLAGCAAVTVWALVDAATDDSGESLALIFPVLATAPVGLILLVTPDGLPAFLLAVVLGALVNAAVIGWCARALRRGEKTPDPYAE
ncbi:MULTISPECIES: SCO4225 family membrane protein [Streptomyces]|uniref:SCO4225 family membrane protein n=1 Tax=Streptomyces TaxID=1883 RepID=UPI0014325787|nr:MULTISPECIES: hypothetical protein [Streptomyces]NJP69475.1 hypothetical protein [Streptomyces sp. C1-2]WTI27950.1 hypothetical protein OHA67_17265 [Streptomyces jietaisiensis]GHE83807.1 hypothetical protein GCM10018782_65210 [Streptomyces griseoaurantiacus]